MVAFFIPTLPAVTSVAANDPAEQFFLRLATPPTQARQQAYTTLIYSLVNAGVWAKLDALYILAAADATTAGINLVQSAGTLTPVNAPTFTANLGYTLSMAAKSYLNTNINPSTLVGAQIQQNAACLFTWTGPLSPLKQDNAAGSGTNGGYTWGQSGFTNLSFAPDTNSGGEIFRCNINDNSDFNVTTTSGPASAGLYYGERSASVGAGCVSGYFNGSFLGTAASGHSSIALQNANLLIGVTDNLTDANRYNNNTICIAGFGQNLGASGQLALYNALNAYMRAVAISAAPDTAFFNRLQTAPSAPRQALYSALINGLVTDGIWPKLDILWVLAAADAVTARTNLVQDAYVLNGTGSTGDPGSASFTVDRGFLGTTGHGTYGSWLYDPAVGNFTSTAKYLTNDAAVMLWNINDGTISGEEVFTFNGNHTSGSFSAFRKTGNTAEGEINADEGINNNHNSVISGVTSAPAMLTISRTPIQTTSFTLYRHTGAPPSDTVQTALPNLSRPSLTLAAGPIIFPQDTSGVRLISALTSGGSLTATDEQNLYQRLYTYLHAVGAV